MSPPSEGYLFPLLHEAVEESASPKKRPQKVPKNALKKALDSAPAIEAQPPSPLISPAPQTESPQPANPFLQKLAVDDFVEGLDKLLSKNIGIVRIMGEVGGLMSASSGHWYFNLKGQRTMIRCVMFRQYAQLCGLSPASLNGMKVEAEGVVGLYQPRGELQLQVKYLRASGEGDLYQAFLRLREKLSSQGLFDASRKKAIPRYPKRIGIITSLQAAALQDVLRVLSQFSPHLEIIIYPTAVQGGKAAGDIILALEAAHQHHSVQLLLMVRGGGSLEDLWCFNDEALIQAMAKATIPIITGIGHESDTTLADLVADLRAPTPTAAARECPPTEALMAQVQSQQNALHAAMNLRINREQQRLDMALRLIKSLRDNLGGQRLQWLHQQLMRGWQRRFALAQQRLINVGERLTAVGALIPLPRHHMDLVGLERRLQQAIRDKLHHEQKHMQHQQALLKAYDPLLPQKKGFALIHTSNEEGTSLISRAAQLSPADKIHAVFVDGEVIAEVTMRNLVKSS